MSFFQPSGSPNAALTSSQTLTFVLTGACADFRPVHHVPIPSAILRFLGAKEIQGTLLALQFVRADVGRGHPSRRTLQLQSELCKCQYAMGMSMTAILQLNPTPSSPPSSNSISVASEASENQEAPIWSSCARIFVHHFSPSLPPPACGLSRTLRWGSRGVEEALTMPTSSAFRGILCNALSRGKPIKAQAFRAFVHFAVHWCRVARCRCIGLGDGVCGRDLGSSMPKRLRGAAEQARLKGGLGDAGVTGDLATGGLAGRGGDCGCGVGIGLGLAPRTGRWPTWGEAATEPGLPAPGRRGLDCPFSGGAEFAR